MASSASQDIPQLPANARMKAFRLEAAITWPEFNRMWTIICNFINAPCNEILVSSTGVSEGDYRKKVLEVTQDVLDTGIFGPGARGRWHFNPGPDGERICEYISAIVSYAAGELVRQIPVNTTHRVIEGDKVGDWLLNQQAGNWGRNDFGDRPEVPASEFEPEGIFSSEASFCSRSTGGGDTVMEEEEDAGSEGSGDSTVIAETVLAAAHKVLRVGRGM